MFSVSYLRFRYHDGDKGGDGTGRDGWRRRDTERGLWGRGAEGIVDTKEVRIEQMSEQAFAG